MLSHKILALLGVGTCLVTYTFAETGFTAEKVRVGYPRPLDLNATLQNGEIVGFEQARRVFMKVGERRLMFVVPQEDLRADLSDPKKVTLVSRDNTCLFTLRITRPETLGLDQLTPDIYRSWLAVELGDMTISDELSQTAANCSGPGFELKGRIDGVTRTCRAAFIPSPVGILEFRVLSSPETFAAAKVMLQAWLRSFQISGADGELKISPVALGQS